MTRETKIGLVVGLGFIVVFAILLSHKGAADHIGPPSVFPPRSGELQYTETTFEREGAFPETPVAPGPDNDPTVIADATEETDAVRPDPESDGNVIEPPAVAGGVPDADRESQKAEVVPAEPIVVTLQPMGPEAEGADPIVTAKTVDPAPVQSSPPPKSAAKPEPSRPVIIVRHEVRQGDTLNGMARRYYNTEATNAVQGIYRANLEQLPKGPHALKLGMVLEIPAWAPRSQFVAAPNPADLSRAMKAPVVPRVAKRPVTSAPGALQTRNQGQAEAEHRVATGPVRNWQWYEVGEKDTLYGIARRVLGSSRRWREIRDLNRLNDPSKLRVGAKIKIPLNGDRDEGRPI